MPARHLDVLFSAAGGARRAYVLVAIATGTDDRRVSAASGQLPRQPAGGSHAGHLHLLTQRRAVDGPGGRIEDLVDRIHAVFRSNAEIGGCGIHLLYVAWLVFLPTGLQRRP